MPACCRPSRASSPCRRRWGGCPAPRGWCRRRRCPAPDLFVSLDAASPGRLGELAPLLDGAVTRSSSTTTPATPASGTLAADRRRGTGHGDPGRRPARRPRRRPRPAAGHCLYAGLSADTGSFRFGNTRPQTHELAARLLATGIDHAAISRRLFDTAPFGWLGLLSAVTGRAVLEREVGAGLVWTWSSTAEAAEHGLPGEQLEALVDVVRSAEEADVACVLKGQDDGTWSVSLRSRGGTDLARVAMQLGGGGHTLAAGYTSTLDREGTMAALRASVEPLTGGTSRRPVRSRRRSSRWPSRRWSSSRPSRCTCWSTPRSSGTWARWRSAGWPSAAACWPGRRAAELPRLRHHRPRRPARPAPVTGRARSPRACRRRGWPWASAWSSCCSSSSRGPVTRLLAGGAGPVAAAGEEWLRIASFGAAAAAGLAGRQRLAARRARAAPSGAVRARRIALSLVALPGAGVPGRAGADRLGGGQRAGQAVTAGLFLRALAREGPPWRPRCAAILPSW